MFKEGMAGKGQWHTEDVEDIFEKISLRVTCNGWTPRLVLAGAPA
jgi:hypothetical protein